MFHSKSKWLLVAVLSLHFAFNCSAQERTAEEQLATRLVEASGKDAQESLLASENALVNVELRKALMSHADRINSGAEWERSAPLYELTLSIADRIGDKQGAMDALGGLQNVYLKAGKRPQILEILDQRISMAEASGDLLMKGEAIRLKGNALYIQGDYVLSLENYNTSLEIFKSLDSKLYLGRAYYNICSLNLLQGEFKKGLENCNRSMSNYTAVNDEKGIADVNGQLARIRMHYGDYEEAIAYNRASIKAFQKIRNEAAAARVLGNLAAIYEGRGDYSKAFEIYTESLRTHEKIGDWPALGARRASLARIYMAQGDYEQALKYFNLNMPMYEKQKNNNGIFGTLSYIGDVHRLQGNYELALEFYRKGLALAESVKNKGAIAGSLVSIGLVYYDQNEPDKALELFEKVWALSPSGKSDTIELLLYMSNAHYSKGNFEKALEMAEKAANMAAESNLRELLWEINIAAGKAYLALGRQDQARRSFDDAIKVIEEIRLNTVGGEQQREGFFENKIFPYQGIIGLLIKQGKADEALVYSERARARVLLDVLQSGKADSSKALSAAEREKERELRESLTSLNNRIGRETSLAKPDPSRINDLDALLRKTRLDYEAFESSLYVTHPELKVKRGETPDITLPMAASLLPDGKSTLLEFAVTSERTYLFVLTKGSQRDQTASLKVYPIEIKRKDLIRDVEAFRRSLAERDPGFVAQSRKLFDLLLTPARAELVGKNNLIVVPDDALWELPFQALQSAPNRYLPEDAALSYAPSLSVLFEMQKQRRGRQRQSTSQLLAFGNPTFSDSTAERTKVALRSKPAPLPEAEREVKTLAEIYGTRRSRVYIRAEAREARAKTEASNFKVLHFATHGILNNSSPMYSGLLLSQDSPEEDGLLEAWEIMKLDLNADLVVLSACETARGRIGAGEGMIGLTWALFVAGSPSTLVSQWKVDSEATRQLMLDFHRNLITGNSKTGITKSEALRQAALKLMRTTEYKHPFNWASFVIIGDSR